MSKIRKMTDEERKRYETEHIAVLDRIDALKEERKDIAAQYREDLKDLQEQELRLRDQLKRGEIDPVQQDAFQK